MLLILHLGWFSFHKFHILAISPSKLIIFGFFEVQICKKKIVGGVEMGPSKITSADVSCSVSAYQTKHYTFLTPTINSQQKLSTFFGHKWWLGHGLFDKFS